MPHKSLKEKQEYRRQWHLKNRKKHLRQMKRYAQSPAGKESKWRSCIKYKFNGFTHVNYESMLKSQKNKCALCGKRLFTHVHADIDHDHTTQNVRGLLHRRCNVVVGIVEKWQNTVSKYLQQAEKAH